VAAVAERVAEKVVGKRGGRKLHGVVGGVREAATSPAADRLRHEAAAFAVVQAERLLAAAGRKAGETTTRLGGGRWLATTVLKGSRRIRVTGARSAVEKGAGTLTTTAKDALRRLPHDRGRRSGDGDDGGFTTIVEDIHVGVPVREAYDQWTQFQDFGRFADGVESVESTDDVTSEWRMKVFGVGRSWTARITEQVPDERIAWTTEGEKGTSRGVVTFHPLGENLTEVLLVIEYHPKGLVEKAANLWRAQGRRARLDLKNFRRFVTLRGEATGGWRGEVRDGETVPHDDGEPPEDEAYEDEEELPAEDEAEDDEIADEVPDDEIADDELPDDEAAEDEAGHDEAGHDEAGEYEIAEDDEEYEDEPEPGPGGRP
jgi:uncharacterized membrane protein